MSDLVVIGSIRGCSDQADLAMIRAMRSKWPIIGVANNRFADATSWDEFANRLEFHRQLIADISNDSRRHFLSRTGTVKNNKMPAINCRSQKARFLLIFQKT